MKYEVNNLFVILFMCVMLSKCRAFTYQLKFDEQPIIIERLAADDIGIGNGEGVETRGITNRVHHKHEQNFGDIHVLTNINIENFVTIYNKSESNFSSVDTTGSTENNMKKLPALTIQSDPIELVNGRQKFERFDRNQRGNSFVFPTSISSSEQSHRVRWPSEQRSSNEIDSKSIESIPSTVVFPRLDLKNKNESSTFNNNVAQQQSPAIEIHPIKGNETALPNLLNISVFVNNQIAIENDLEPLAYIDENGIFQVKYVRKSDYKNSNGQNLTSSVNKPNQTPIISNDNLQNHHKINETNETTTPTIDSIQNNFDLNDLQPKDASSSQSMQQNETQQQNIHEQLILSP